MRLLAPHFFSARIGFLVSVASIASLSACVTRRDVDQILENQRDIQSRLERMEGSLKTRPVPNLVPPTPPTVQPSAEDTMAYVVGKAPVRGKADAWVTIVEVSDFQCPFCQRGANTLKEVQKAYGNDVRIVFKHMPLPFHQRATPAAVAAICAGAQKRFWEMHDKIFEHQDQLGDEHLLTFAKELKLHPGEFKKCINGADARRVVTEDAAQAEKFGVRGTPGFFVNGKFLSGAQPFNTFKALVDAELERAKKSGIEKKDYYAKAVEEGGKKGL